jgi:ABC-type bacteriocin/lantibiotic exporter with double-glycine peptidase domain
VRRLSFLWASLLLTCEVIACGAVALAESSGISPGIWIDVPFVAQPSQGCGAATIAMVMQYWQLKAGQPVSANADAGQILRTLHSDQAHGIYASDMVHYFAQNGFRTFAFASDETDLQQHLAAGRPLIAAIKPGRGLPLHFVVVAGLIPTEHVVLLNDPAQRKLLKEDKARFEREWKAAGYWTLLALPQSAAHSTCDSSPISI